MNLSDFTKQGPNKEDKIEKNENADIMKTYEELKDMNGDQLSQRLFEEVASQKQNGTFDYDMLSSSVESIKAYLPQETYENIKRILRTLR